MSFFNSPTGIGLIAGGIPGALVGKSLQNASDQPGFQSTQVDPGTYAIGQRMHTAAENETPEEAQRQILEGTNQSGSLMNQQQLSSQEHGMGMLSGNSQQQALLNKSNRSYQNEMSQLTRSAGVQGFQNSLQARMIDQQNQEKLDEFNFKVNKARAQSQLNLNAARNAVIGEALGAIGMGAGMALGGPMGAAAGGAVGKGMAGSSQQSQV